VESHITAEGVEMENELAALRAIGVDKAQGFLLAKPRPLEDVVANSSLPFPASLGASSA
jgi:EAL domain-containing protein (putative c-di-GMP-specific phosphodiesterase class I)